MARTTLHSCLVSTHVLSDSGRSFQNSLREKEKVEKPKRLFIQNGVMYHVVEYILHCMPLNETKTAFSVKLHVTADLKLK